MVIRLAAVVLLVGLALWLSSLFDVLTAPAGSVRSLPKALWVLIVILLTVPGAICWLLLGRPRQPVRTGRTRAITAPDDDPEFLRRLAEQMRRERDEPL